MNHRAKPYPNLSQAFAGLLIAAGLALSACTAEPAAPEEPPLAGADIGGDFELINSAGETVRWTDFEGKYRIVYFGFAYCPDICPNDMSKMTRGLNIAIERKPDLAHKIQPMFITIDPERDTPEVVGEFASAFSENLLGLTGTPEQIRAAADAFRVYYERGEDLGNGQYLMNHSAIVYLFGPKGEPLATLPTDLGPEAVAAEIEKWVN